MTTEATMQDVWAEESLRRVSVTPREDGGAMIRIYTDGGGPEITATVAGWRWRRLTAAACTAAVAEERAACAEVAEAYRRSAEAQAMHPHAVGVCRDIVAAIRARSAS